MKHRTKSRANIILGGVGDDTHNVGLSILANILLDIGFNVIQTGAQTEQKVFIEAMEQNKTDALIILSYSGHAEENIVGLKEKCIVNGISNIKFYIGGFLSISDDSPEDIKRVFNNHGFDRVYTTQNKFEDIIFDLNADFPVPEYKIQGSLRMYCKNSNKNKQSIKNAKWDKKQFLDTRENVLSSWQTGKNVGSLEDVVDYQLTIPKNKIYSNILDKAIEKGDVLVQPRAGVSDIQGHTDLLRLLAENGADFLPTTVDSYTRKNDYQTVESALQRKVPLNGFPIINHGVAVCRKIAKEMKKPLQVRHGTPDARLLAEISFAGGFTAFEGGAICYTLPYSKKADLSESISNWQYVDKLVGLLGEKGVKIHREFYGALTGLLVEPSISHAIGIIEALLAAEQGVKHMSLSYAENGNLVQDVASIRTLKPLADEYLKKMGYNDIYTSTVFYQYMGPFPRYLEKAKMIIKNSAYVAALSGANKIISKTIDEAYKIPTKECNADAVSMVKEAANSNDNPFSDIYLEGLDEEMNLIALETKLIVDAVIELGKGDIAIGTVAAFKKGILDIPFAPNVLNMNKVKTVYDTDGAVRFYNTGCLPFSNSIKEFHKRRVKQRVNKQGEKFAYEMVLQDIQRIGEGSFDKWPIISIPHNKLHEYKITKLANNIKYVNH